MPSIKKLSRDALNEKALKLGIADAVEMNNRAAVIEAIEEAKRDDRPEARVISVFANGLRVMVEMHVDRAREEFGEEGLANAGGADVVDATNAQLAEIRKVAPDVANSALAAAALRMAYELDHPYNSATAKSYCIKELRQSMDRLLELAAEEDDGEGSRLDELRARRYAKGKSAA